MQKNEIKTMTICEAAQYAYNMTEPSQNRLILARPLSRLLVEQCIKRNTFVATVEIKYGSLYRVRLDFTSTDIPYVMRLDDLLADWIVLTPELIDLIEVQHG